MCMSAVQCWTPDRHHVQSRWAPANAMSHPDMSETKKTQVPDSKRMRILMVEYEPSGDYQLRPDLSVLDSDMYPLHLRPVDQFLLQAAATYPCLYHSGPHSGSVASHLARNYARSFKIIRRMANTNSVDGKDDGDDELLETEMIKADYVVHALTIQFDLDAELEEFVKHVKGVVTGTKSMVHNSDVDRVGEVTVCDSGWKAFADFWTDNDCDKITEMSAFNVKEHLQGEPYWIDICDSFDPEDVAAPYVEDSNVRVIRLPVFHTYESSAGPDGLFNFSYIGVADKSHQSEWMNIVSFGFDHINLQAGGDGVNYPDTVSEWRSMVWKNEGDRLVCHDVYTTVNLYFDSRAHRCPAVGTRWIGLRDTICMSRKRRRELSLPEPVIKFDVRLDGIYCGAVRMCDTEQWSKSGIVIVGPDKTSDIAPVHALADHGSKLQP